MWRKEKEKGDEYRDHEGEVEDAKVSIPDIHIRIEDKTLIRIMIEMMEPFKAMVRRPWCNKGHQHCIDLVPCDHPQLYHAGLNSYEVED